MTFPIPPPNLVLAWLWIPLGFVLGTCLGLFFHRGVWLGGHASFRRRLYRLTHISFFGFGAANLFFYVTTRTRSVYSMFAVASWALIVGTVSMPIGCRVMAHFPKCRMLFAVPVIGLIAGGASTLMEVIGL